MTLRDEWKRASKPHRCSLCEEPIPIGQLHRYWVGKDGGQIVTARMHAECLLVTQHDKWDYIDWETNSDPADFRTRRDELRTQGKLGGAD